MPDELTPDSIAESATAPQSATVDGTTVAAHSIPDQIAADQYRKGTAAVSGTNTGGGPKSGWRATRMGKVTPPGAV
jgi:hypothetical protein